MKNQTALDWFWDKMKSYFEHDGELFETASFTFAIAKEKEREQIIEAHGDEQSHLQDDGSWRTVSAEQYYNETYGSKGSDATSSQTEISDEEIEKWVASTPYYGHCTHEYKEGLDEGAKWYREQLKSKQ